MRVGLPESAALEAVTLATARILGVDGRVGSIEPGKDADLVALGGEPLDATAPVLWVMAGGAMGPFALERRF
jgi:imidazolonepropionase-like amidohydrolase